jgi:hypothetical protein
MKTTLRPYLDLTAKSSVFSQFGLILLALCLSACGGGNQSSAPGSAPGRPATPFPEPIANSFFGMAFQNACSITNNGPNGPCNNPEFHSFPSVPFGLASSLNSANNNMKWSDLVQCDPTGSVCPIAGSACSKTGVGANGQPCPAADLVPNCIPNAAAPDDPSNCAYVWTTFDYWTIMYNAHGINWMYVPYYTPDYLSVRGSRCIAPGHADFGGDPTCLATADVCQNQTGFMWGCDPPSDIDAIPGSGLADGTDQNYINFVEALGQHVFNSFETINYWNVWDQPDICSRWNHNDQPSVDCTKLNPGGGPSFGTVPQLGRLATDARATLSLEFVKGVKFVSPSFANVVSNAAYLQLLIASGPSAFDSVGYQGYFTDGVGCPSHCPVPEIEAVDWDSVLNSLVLIGLPNKTAIDTAFSWGPTSNVTDPDMRISFVARSFLLQESNYPQLNRALWVGEDFPIDLTPNPNNGNLPNGGNGQLWASGVNNIQDNCLIPDSGQGGFDCPAGVALKQVAKWTEGNTFSSACTCSTSPNGGNCSAIPPSGIWQCPIFGPNAYQGLFVWDSTVTSFPCTNLACGSTMFTIPPQYAADWRDLTGTVTLLNGATTVMVGAKPILIENQ